MLYDENFKPILKMAYEQQYNEYVSRIPKDDFQRIVDDLQNELNKADEQEGNELLTSSWLPGRDWSGTSYHAIYESCNEDEELAGMLFGLILKDVVIQDARHWGSGRYEKEGVPIEGKTYFRLKKPPM